MLIRLLRESIIIAFQALIMNKLRTLLSVIGITIGIFSIITVLAIVDSMERYLRTNISALGNDVIFIQKWPWYEENYQWWKYMNRPIPTENDFKTVAKSVRYGNTPALMINLNGVVLKFGSNNVSNTTALGVTHNWQNVKNFEIVNGRYFTEFESGNGSAAVIIGNDIAENLFNGLDPVGRVIKVSGRSLTVIGVFKKEGQSLIDNSLDNMIVMPYGFALGMSKKDSERSNPTIMVKAKENVPLSFLEDELKGIMRAARRIKPGNEDNFALNKTTLLSDGIGQLFTIIRFAGGIIGLFSILVGGFGIANIMFVSVKERTNEIGVQKALGAKNYFILLEFLTESVTLCVVGGVVGLLMVYFTTMYFSKAIDFDMALSAVNVITGLFISIFVGILFGFIPAYMASRLNPVDAMRAK